MDRRGNGPLAHQWRQRGKASSGVKAPPQNDRELGERLYSLAGQIEQHNGSDWIKTLIESMRAEWGCTLEQAVYSESLTAALVLWPSLLARHGAEVHFDHGDQARQDGKAAMREWIEAHFTIDPAALPAPDWLTRPLPVPPGASPPPYRGGTSAA